MTKRPLLPDPHGGRSIPEWIGKSPDSKVPDEVCIRVLLRAGKRCYLSGRAITDSNWEIEHIKALSLGGEHRESNLAPVLKDSHKAKSKEEAGRRAKADRQLRQQFLPKKAKDKMKGRGFQTNRDSPFKAKIGGGIVRR